MDDVALANLIAGSNRSNVDMGGVFRPIARALNVPAGTIVWLSEYNYLKNKFKHPTVQFREYCYYDEIAANGFVVLRRNSPSIDIWYLSDKRELSDGWRIGIKRTSVGDLFLVTMHEANLKELRRAYKQANSSGSLVRDAPTRMAQRLMRRAISA